MTPTFTSFYELLLQKNEKDRKKLAHRKYSAPAFAIIKYHGKGKIGTKFGNTFLSKKLAHVNAPA